MGGDVKGNVRGKMQGNVGIEMEGDVKGNVGTRVIQWISLKNTDLFLNADTPLPRRLQTDFEAAIDPGQLTIELHEKLRSISARAVNICCTIPKYSGFKSLNIMTSFNLCSRRNKC